MQHGSGVFRICGGMAGYAWMVWGLRVCGCGQATVIMSVSSLREGGVTCPQWHCRAEACAWSSPARTARTLAAGAWQRLDALPDPRSRKGGSTRVVEGALEGELDDHLGYGKHDLAGRDGGTSRDGYRAKTVLTDTDPMEITVPHDGPAASMVGLALSDPVSWPAPQMATSTVTSRYRMAAAAAWDRVRRSWPIARPGWTTMARCRSAGNLYPPACKWIICLVAAIPSRCGYGGPLWRRSCWRKSVLAGVLARFDLDHRFRLFKQILGWTGPKIRALHAAECPPGGRPAPPVGTARPAGGLTRPGSAGVLRTSAGPCPAWPVHRTPANLDRAATLKARRECAAQVKRQAQTGSLCKPGISRQPSH